MRNKIRYSIFVDGVPSGFVTTPPTTHTSFVSKLARFIINGRGYNTDFYTSGSVAGASIYFRKV